MQSESSESEYESSKSEEPVPTPEPIRGNVVRRDPRTRSGRSQSILSRAQIREAETKKLEERWKREDNPPVIPDFTAQLSINADFTNDSQSLEFLDLFLDNKLYMYLTAQNNL